MLKYSTIFGLSALTCTSMYGCNLQYQKYLKSKKKWDKIYSLLDNNNPENLNIDKIDYINKHSPKDWEFDYVNFEGEFLQKVYYIYRNKFSRQGYYILIPLKNKINDFIIFANIGWIPQNVKDQKFDFSKQKYYEGMLKKSENLEILKNQKKILDENKENLYFDIDKFSQEINSDKIEKKFILEVFKQENDNEIYPYRTDKNNFELPYLTPQRHLEYSFFWGSSSLIGIWGLLKLIIK